MERALDTVVDEIGRSPIPGLYLLFDEKKEKKGYYSALMGSNKRLV
jgi:hypothetical protein